MKTRLSVAIIGALLFAPAAIAATPINQRKVLDADGEVSIDNIQGRIVVRTWARPEVKITGSLGEGVEKLIVEGDRRHLLIKVKYPQNVGGWGWWGSGKGNTEPTVLEVTVPAKAGLEIDAVSADVDVLGAGGRRLQISSVSGDVLVANSVVGEADIESVSGNASIRLDSVNVSAQTVSGDLRLEGRLSGAVSLESVSGDVTLATGALRKLSLDTVSGDGHLRVGVLEGGSLSTESVSGDVSLTLPASTSARLHVETFSGDIHSPVGRVVKEEFGPGQSLDARMGSGSATIKLESFSGKVTIEAR